MSATSGSDIEKTMTAVILAGGKSERMGTDKALLLWNGETLLERTARICVEARLPVVIAGRDRPDGWLQPASFVIDKSPHQGPMGGLITALGAIDTDYVLALGCDMPLISRDAISWLTEIATSLGSGDDGLAVETGGVIQPLFSIYARKCLALMERRMAEERGSLKGMIHAGNFRQAVAPVWVVDKLVDINTRDDFSSVHAAEMVM